MTLGIILDIILFLIAVVGVFFVGFLIAWLLEKIFHIHLR